MISSRYIDVPEVLSVQVVPSVEVRMVRLLPTETSNSVVLSVVVLDVLLLLLHEIMVRLKRNRERKMSRCFTRFPISGYRRTQYIPRFGGVLQGSGKYPKIFTSNIRCIENSILGLLGCRRLSENIGE